MAPALPSLRTLVGGGDIGSVVGDGGFQEPVLAEGADREVGQAKGVLQGKTSAGGRGGRGRAAYELGRDEDRDAVREPRLHEGPGELAPRLEEHRGDLHREEARA